MTMSASGSGKRAMLSTAVPSELRTPLIVATLLPLSLTPQSKEVQINNAGDNNSGDNDVAVAITPIQMVRTLKIHKLDLYYNN